MGPDKFTPKTQPTSRSKRLAVIIGSVLLVVYLVASAVFMVGKISNNGLPAIGFWLRNFETNNKLIPKQQALAQITDCQVQTIAKKSRGKDGYNVIFTYRKDGHTEPVDYRKFAELKAAAIQNSERCGGIAVIE